MGEQMSNIVIGIDEVGTGALAGPVAVAAVILGDPILGVKDSKKLSQKKREELEPIIKEKSLYWVVAASDAKLINSKGVKRCHTDCIRLVARCAKSFFPDGEIILDGDRPVHKLGHHRCVVKADETIPSVSAASILAKVYRDNVMLELSAVFDCYGWERNKGYGTAEHKRALKRFGPSPHHRKDYEPVRGVIMRMKYLKGDRK